MSAENSIKINMLGEFSIEYKGAVISDSVSRSKKLWKLLEYLLTLRGSGVTQPELIELLWDDDDSGDPANALKAIVHRARGLISQLGLDGKRILGFRRGNYFWNTEGFEVDIDIDRFESLLAQAEAAADEGDKLSLLLAAMVVYKGDYLPQMALEKWAVPVASYYHTKYVAAAKQTIELLDAAGRHKDIVELCRSAVMIDPYDEGLHAALIRALYNSGQPQAALAHYGQTTDLFFVHFGINPSPEFTALYKEITRTTNAVEQDIGAIKDRLQEEGELAGPYFCEFEVFKDVYRLELRAQSRTGQVICLCLLTVSAADGSRPGQKLLAATMGKLAETISGALRQNDVFTRFSVSQYLLMLPGATMENSELVINRLIRAFKRGNPRLAAMVRYRLQPLNPLDDLDALQSFAPPR